LLPSDRETPLVIAAQILHRNTFTAFIGRDCAGSGDGKEVNVCGEEGGCEREG
jgi:hypothetical protein